MHPGVHMVGGDDLVRLVASHSHLGCVVAVADVVVAADWAVGMGGSHCIAPAAPAVADGRLRHLYGSGVGAGYRWGRG
jgi:hypothetical protein